MCTSTFASLYHAGIPPTPKTYSTFTYGPNSVTMTLSTASSGAGTTGSFAFHVVSSKPYVNQSFPFPSYVGGTKVTVMITNLQDGVTYFFSVYASNVYGISDSANVLVTAQCESWVFTLMHLCSALVGGQSI